MAAHPHLLLDTGIAEPRRGHGVTSFDNRKRQARSPHGAARDDTPVPVYIGLLALNAALSLPRGAFCRMIMDEGLLVPCRCRKKTSGPSHDPAFLPEAVDPTYAVSLRLRERRLMREPAIRASESFRAGRRLNFRDSIGMPQIKERSLRYTLHSCSTLSASPGGSPLLALFLRFFKNNPTYRAGWRR